MNPFGNAVNDLKEYLGADYKECDGALEVAKQWNKCQDYTKLDAYMYDLAQWHDTKNRKGINTQTLNILKRNGIKEVMDLGAGICSDAIMMAQNGVAVTTVDFPSPYYEFGKWRMQKYGVCVKMLDLPSFDADIRHVESILMIDTLEHVVNYKDLLWVLSCHTDKIIEKTPFGYHEKNDVVGDKYPLHTHNTRKEVYECLRGLKFEIADKSGQFGPKLWVKNYARPEGSP
jgi:hypothetical protein